MTSSGLADVDFIDELRMRCWARENYVPRDKRQTEWHPVVLEEMEKKDRDLGDSMPTPTYAWTAY